MCSIAGRLGSLLARVGGVDSEIPAWRYFDPNRDITVFGTVAGGQFDWGGRLLKSNGGAQRFPQVEWKPTGECTGTRELDCEPNTASRDESRAE